MTGWRACLADCEVGRWLAATASGGALACALGVVITDRHAQVGCAVARDDGERVTLGRGYPGTLPTVDQVRVIPVPAKIIKRGLFLCAEHPVCLPGWPLPHIPHQDIPDLTSADSVLMCLDFDLVNRGPVLPYQRIVDEWREKITSGAMLAGEQLPSVTQLCDIHHVSRVTVLKALTILRDDGLIVTVPRWGSFVAER